MSPHVRYFIELLFDKIQTVKELIGEEYFAPNEPYITQKANGSFTSSSSPQKNQSLRDALVALAPKNTQQRGHKIWYSRCLSFTTNLEQHATKEENTIYKRFFQRRQSLNQTIFFQQTGKSFCSVVLVSILMFFITTKCYHVRADDKLRQSEGLFLTSFFRKNPGKLLQKITDGFF